MFASLGFQNIGRDLPYSKIADSLQVEPSEVEKWAINGEFLSPDSYRLPSQVILVIRAGLLTGKLSQTTQTIHVVRSTSRTFEREQWEALEKRLLAWKTSLAGVLDVGTAARKRGETQQSGSQSTTSAPPQTVAT
jgi:translation initiation factor 3 subunit M